MTKRKLIEVALPLEAINAACKSDKDRKTGTIRNLHKWFAPMPVPALRALIFASLVDDPEDDDERQRLLRITENLVNSVVSDPPEQVLREARAAIAASLSDLPIVLDPFCGGGSTIVEAQRLGLRGEGSDLNPIPALISSMLTVFPAELRNSEPINDSDRGAFWSGNDGLEADLRHYAALVRSEVFSRIGDLYPLSKNGDPIIAWWWARTVPSPDPRFQDCVTPIVTNWWLSKKSSELAFGIPIVEKDSNRPHIEIRHQGKPESPVGRVCHFSGAPLSFEYIKEQGELGRIGAQLCGMVTHGQHGRQYLSADDEQEELALSIDSSGSKPNLDLPDQALGFTFQLYGNSQWSDVFTSRQLVLLTTFADVIRDLPDKIRRDGGSELQVRAISTFLALCLGKLAQFSSSQCLWKIDSRNGSGKAESAKFGRNDLTMTWDYVETNPFGGSVGDWNQVVETALRALDYVSRSGPPARITQCDARNAAKDLDGRCLVITDPPYFSAIGYANLSDYFYIWIRQALKELEPGLFATVASPKTGELISEPARHTSKDEAKTYFIDGFTEVFANLQRASMPDLPMVVIYAYKEQEQEKGSQVSSGWEAMLEAIIRSGHSIVGTWPIHGTGSTRMRGLKANALASYVALVCRPRQENLSRISRREFQLLLKSELTTAISLLQQAAIAPVDLAQAVIGPGMGVFTSFESVLEPDGSMMSVRSALLLINSVLSEVFEEDEGDLDSETRWAIAWFQQNQYRESTSGEADSLARSKVTSIEALERSGVIGTRAGKTRLLMREEMPSDYDPQRDQRLTIWECVQYLVREMSNGGEVAASRALARVPNQDAVRSIAYRLYAICEKNRWSEEGNAYNSLVASWSEITRLAQTSNNTSVSANEKLPGI